ncbi:transcriptional repressor LexA [uncultured Helcococcus sp.]|uniref:transcriptional repressor LexA n=1 Tax=uncultured Helcococcus sp. TaxID=1072508 RepID=UPI0026214A23|nr:transcriptional repressor LexA [uncultured Helcococcus sp.]
MNDRQKQVLDFIKQFIAKNQLAPTVRDIQNGVGIKSTSTVSNDLTKLEKEGYIEKSNLKSRAIKLLVDNEYEDEILSSKEETIDIPVLGNIAAGSPTYAEENIESYYPVPTHITKNKDYFLLKVKGDSMIEAGILEDDLILVEKTNYANHGEIVVALIEDSATVKRLYKKNGQVMLIPENSSMEPIIPEYMEILGKVISLFRENI